MIDKVSARRVYVTGSFSRMWQATRGLKLALTTLTFIWEREEKEGGGGGGGGGGGRSGFLHVQCQFPKKKQPKDLSRWSLLACWPTHFKDKTFHLLSSKTSHFHQTWATRWKANESFHFRILRKQLEQMCKINLIKSFTPSQERSCCCCSCCCYPN